MGATIPVFRNQNSNLLESESEIVESYHLYHYQDAVEAGVTVVNEVGADPGIDHLLAMECFDEVLRDKINYGGLIN